MNKRVIYSDTKLQSIMLQISLMYSRHPRDFTGIILYSGLAIHIYDIGGILSYMQPCMHASNTYLLQHLQHQSSLIFF